MAAAIACAFLRCSRALSTGRPWCCKVTVVCSCPSTVPACKYLSSASSFRKLWWHPVRPQLALHRGSWLSLAPSPKPARDAVLLSLSKNAMGSVLSAARPWCCRGALACSCPFTMPACGVHCINVSRIQNLRHDPVSPCTPAPLHRLHAAQSRQSKCP